ncbi:hypothetical protein GJ496_010125 [Pomphorhynchus laevis]|nr:hypothetical protein GJ496_010125 [Pomphorhynchus laevis]
MDSDYKYIPGSVGDLNARKCARDSALLENREVAVATVAIVSTPEPHMFTENDVLSFHRTNLGRRNLTSLTTETDLQETINEAVAENKGSFDFTESIKMTGTKMRDTDSKEEYCESFKLRQIMTNLKGKLTDDKELQNFEETRVNRIKSCLDTYVQCHEVSPRIKSCLHEMLQPSASISFASDAKHVIDFSHSAYLQPPDEVPIDFNMSDGSTHRLSYKNTTLDRGTPVNDSMSSLTNTLRRSRFRTLFKINDMVRNRKSSVFAREKYTDLQMSKLPPEQRIIPSAYAQPYRVPIEHKTAGTAGYTENAANIQREPEIPRENRRRQKNQGDGYRHFRPQPQNKNEQILINELSENLTISKASIKRLTVGSLNGTDCNDNRNQTNFTGVDDLDDVRTSNKKRFGKGIISTSAGQDMMTIEADNGDSRTKVENACGKKKRSVKIDVDENSYDDISLHVIENKDDDVNTNSDEDENEDDSDEEEVDNNKL